MNRDGDLRRGGGEERRRGRWRDGMRRSAGLNSWRVRAQLEAVAKANERGGGPRCLPGSAHPEGSAVKRGLINLPVNISLGLNRAGFILYDALYAKLFKQQI